MSDITKCKGLDCPIKETCYRYKAQDNEFRQSYFTNTPYRIEDGVIVCDYYWTDSDK